MAQTGGPDCPVCRTPMKRVGPKDGPDGHEQEWQCQNCWKIYALKEKR